MGTEAVIEQQEVQPDYRRGIPSIGFNEVHPSMNGVRVTFPLDM
jgi:hypothetical protein